MVGAGGFPFFPLSSFLSVFPVSLVLSGAALVATGYLAKIRYLHPLGISLIACVFVPDPFKLVSFGLLSGLGLLFFKAGKPVRPGNAALGEGKEGKGRAPRKKRGV